MSEAVRKNLVIRRFGGLFARAGRAFGAAAQRPTIDPLELNGLSALTQSVPVQTLLTKPSDSSWLFQIPPLQVPELSQADHELNFKSILECTHHFKDLSCELFEALLWEPLWSGHGPSGSYDLEALQLSLSGGKLWYRDLVVVPMLRESAPLGEILVSPDFRSEANFHVYRAFAARGYTGHEQNIALFSELFTSAPRATAADRFRLQLHTHYRDSGVVPRGLTSRLSRSGFWREFNRRFLSREGLPSLLSRELTRLFRPGSSPAYISGCHRYLRNGLAQAPKTTIAKVRARRTIQQRALQALQIHSALERGEFVAGRGFDSGYACVALEMYLDILEDALDALAEENVRVNTLIRKADAYYAENLRSYFLGFRARARLIEPRDMLKFAVEELDFFEKVRPSSRLLEYAVGAARGSDLRKVADHELVRDTWSLPLSQIDPQSGVFGEIFARKEAK
jgi:hypothetical protein